MPQFDDYHRTVIGYHGTTLSAALRIVNRIEPFRPSSRDYDWLGRGIYFWEYAPRQALKWAKLRQKQLRAKKDKTPADEKRVNEPIAVVASMIRLGYCFDLLDSDNVGYLSELFERYIDGKRLAGEQVPRNSRRYRRLDCEVFEYAYSVILVDSGSRPIDTCRGVYVPTEGKQRVWTGSWISKDVNVQLCVRNPDCILGSWLHYPDKVEVRDAVQTLEDSDLDIQRANPQGIRTLQEDADGVEG